ncbi:MAG: hypothetical protein K2Q03_06825 [Sphingobacteriaceae bacterium]|nr:hypothetical protein [Sphingobacteriaceae bacterium]
MTPEIGTSWFNTKNKRNFSRKGDFFVHWGYNFSWYANSDITFQGDGANGLPAYKFTLRDVAAKDRPTPLSIDYIDPKWISTPQFNFHFGYFIKDNYSISIGWDHMKYVMDSNQTLKVDGEIPAKIPSTQASTGAYAGTYYNRDLMVGDDMLKFEHTDGFNYASVELERHDDMWVSKSQTRSFTLETGFGLGVVVPRTDSRLFGSGRNHYWNVAGYGASVKAGVKYYFTKGFYIQNTVKAGVTDLVNIRTTEFNAFDKASQSISYLQNMTLLAYQF